MSAVPAQNTKDSSAPKPHRRSLKGPVWLWAVIGAGVIFGMCWLGYRKLHPADNLGTLILGKVQEGDLVETVSASGSVEPQTGAEVHIGSQITGRIKRLYTDVGRMVKAGDVIAQLDLPDIEAAYTQSKFNYIAATSKVKQAQEALALGESQTHFAVASADETLNSAKQTVKSASANYRLQSVATPTDVEKAQAALGVANAAKDSAEASLDQVQLGAKLNIAAAQEAVAQAQATYTLNITTLNRQMVLYKQGFVAPLTVDQARQASDVSLSLLHASQEQLNLTQQKVAADLKTANSTFVQAQKTVVSAIAALKAAKAEVYVTAARKADLGTAIASSKAAAANVNTAIGNLTTNQINKELVDQALEAQKVALQQEIINGAQWDRCLIKSPIAGTILSLAAQQGETVAAGLAAPTLVVVADLSRLEVEAYVDETDIGKVHLGQPAKVTVDAFPTQVFKGTITKVASGSTIQVGVVTYDVTISIEDPKLQLRPDMTATSTIITGTLHNTLMVPAVAIQATLNGSFVRVLTTKNGVKQVTSVPVTTGGTDGVNVAILSGLKAGQQIVLAGGKSPSSSTGGASAFGGAGSGRH